VSHYKYAPKADANHGEIVAAYEELYCLVIDTHKVGGGFGDLVVRIGTKRGPILHEVEIKTADGDLSAKQERHHAEWGSVVAIVQTVEDVRAHVAHVRMMNMGVV
jgi:hypothetical protein